MLYVFCGNDTEKVRATAIAKADSVKESGASVTTIDTQSYTEGVLHDAVGATSLFGEVELFVIDTPTKEFAAEVQNQLEAMAESSNIFVVIEGALLAPQKKPYQKHAATFEEYKAGTSERFNVFAMADALASKNKKQLWILLQQAKQAGLSEEEIIGTLWWQLKSLRLAAHTNSAAEAGMKDWPYQKAKKSLVSFQTGELEKLSHRLLSAYHQGHSGEVALDVALEEWILTI